ncbi:hypothetical protein TRFO_12435 [Tritrichomonas foetus]|uniref:RRM domain-containing protein n=1 Tax=Tritrichomonas foetus TaxID=1144522 RepID=A0A1J4L5S9_9EUKA|nr:hypothetical protein TRFO_12435 [Tritrichomonas foetus]|eukprot:OHT17301.1 hypothetical protein TRFO_12435 [Tritrichomonas foetus]
MFVTPLSQYTHEDSDYFNQNSFIFPSYAPLTPTVFEKINQYSNHDKNNFDFSHLLSRVSNTVIVKNIKIIRNQAALFEMFKNAGEISNYFPHLNKGFAIVIYFDSRSAERACKMFNGVNYEGSRIICDFVFKTESSKYYEKEKMKCPNVLLKPIQENRSSLSESEINNFMSKFGEIRQVIACSNNSFIIEFYDFRCARNAMKEGSLVIKQTFFNMETVLDINMKIKQISTETSIVHKFSGETEESVQKLHQFFFQKV